MGNFGHAGAYPEQFTVKGKSEVSRSIKPNDRLASDECVKASVSVPCFGCALALSGVSEWNDWFVAPADRKVSSPLLMTESVLNQMSVTVDQNRRISEIVRREQNHLQNFIRRRVLSDSDAEDVLQDVFCELVGAYRLMKPMEHATAWLYRVARNRIIDRFRKKKPEIFSNVLVDRREDGE